jgi:AraC-like DNA-binding protein
MKLHVKNMVCKRCILVVETELKKIGVPTLKVSLGEIELEKAIDAAAKKELDEHLRSFGFELIDDKKGKLIEQIKTLIIDLVHHKNSALAINLSNYLTDQLHYEYSYLSHLFSEIEGTTIEHYFIAQKIEKVKELLVYNELTLSEIADHLNYSSVAHLSNQFKKMTGLTPSHFKKVKQDKRKPLDEV